MRATIRRAAIWIQVTAAAALAAAGCAREPAPSPSRAEVLRIGSYLAADAHPSKRTLVGLLSSEPLVSPGWDGRPVFKLAEQVVESEDRAALIVTVRSGARFHDGQRVTAPAVAALIEPKLNRPGTLVPEISRAEAINDTQLKLWLRVPGSLRPEDLAQLFIDDDGRMAMRTGPFRVVATEPYVLERYAQYHQGVPTISRVEIVTYGSHRGAWSALLRHDVNVLHEASPEAFEFLEADGNVRAYPMLRPYYSMLAFSVRHPSLRRREVRIAIGEAIDREELLRSAMRGHGQVAEGPFWPYHWAYPNGLFPVAFNPEAARLRLEAAGLKVVRHGRDRMPSRFAFTCIVPSGDPRFERMALLIQRQLSAVGIDMRLESVPVSALMRRAGSGDFDALLYEANAGRNLRWARVFWRSAERDTRPFLNTGHTGADLALDRLRTARGDREIREALTQAMRVMREDPPAAFLVWPREARAADAAIAIPYETDRDIFGTLWQARPAPPQQVARQ